MRYAFFLVGDNLPLAAAEVLSLVPCQKKKLYDRLLVLDAKSVQNAQRLAFTCWYGRILFMCKKKELFHKIRTTDWNKEYSKDFRVRVYGKTNLSDRLLGGMVYEQLKKPLVNLEKPSTDFAFVIRGNSVFCIRILHHLDDNYTARLPHKRPAFFPVSLHPRLAKCCVNLAGAHKKLVDPFVGSGGIVLEAGLMGLFVEGFDIDKRMIDATICNLLHFNVKNFSVIQKDALTLKRPLEYVVSDLPYGRAIKMRDLGGLYREFFVCLRILLKKRAVLIFPDSIRVQPMIKKAGLKICGAYSVYVHRSLTKKIYVLE